MKISIELEGEYGVDSTRVERTVTWAEDGDDSIEAVEFSGDVVVSYDPHREHLAKITTQIAKLAVDIHTTR